MFSVAKHKIAHRITYSSNDYAFLVRQVEPFQSEEVFTAETYDDAVRLVEILQRHSKDLIEHMNLYSSSVPSEDRNPEQSYLFNQTNISN